MFFQFHHKQQKLEKNSKTDPLKYQQTKKPKNRVETTTLFLGFFD
jgi:hypothetical protein